MSSKGWPLDKAPPAPIPSEIKSDPIHHLIPLHHICDKAVQR